MAAKCDWAAVERDYRTGCYTNRELGRRHNVSEGSIRNRAAKEEWQKDLSEMIRQRVREKTGRAAAAAITAATNDAEIVEQAAEAGAQLIHGHQVLIARTRGITQQYVERISEQVANGKIIVMTPKGLPVEIDIPLDYVGKSLGHATQSIERLIRLERQAHGLDTDKDRESAGKSLEELLAEAAGDGE
ncbi:hypothetical protein [Pseudomonas canadensis]|jgi:hypothetical protein|uniref:hypothetical protein n=1 Tax=Pseudomonas canadensis TaxID=915099 RepID=UPI000F060B6E|nr:hypothetical protein [Pseudomonas canadensis]WLH27423.1 hypothetical protein PSH56_15220 [Pseudomonas canadensis]